MNIRCLQSAVCPRNMVNTSGTKILFVLLKCTQKPDIVGQCYNVKQLVACQSSNMSNVAPKQRGGSNGSRMTGQVCNDERREVVKGLFDYAKRYYTRFFVIKIIDNCSPNCTVQDLNVLDILFDEYWNSEEHFIIPMKANKCVISFRDSIVNETQLGCCTYREQPLTATW